MGDMKTNGEIRITDNEIDQAWEKLNQRILEEEKKKVLGLRFEGFPMYYKIAAILLVVLASVISVWITMSKNNDYVTYYTYAGEMSYYILPDGTLVELNESSELTYPKEFSKDTRKVHLEGEAFFKVKKNPSKPFIVETDILDVKVLGTSFNVYSRKGKTGEIFVQEGKVSVNSGSVKEPVLLTDGQMGIVNKKEIIKDDNENVNYLAWKTKHIIFKSTGLVEVVKTLNHTYNCEIEILNEELFDLEWTTEIVNQPLNLALEALNSNFREIDIVKDKNKILVISSDKNQ